MIEKNVTIKNETGLHARPAAALVQFVKKYEASVEIIVDNKVADAKSIFNVMSLGISKGTEIVLRVDGENEESVIEEVSNFIDNLAD
ncbi:MAG: HPr family phosphocarrier protein [Peptoniphilaceae bacterium]|uniref:HPr family phosphocarrier protein n=1 Tax=Parvimonas sp. TaxID=1944660 RepID=UPI0025F4EA5F|nr:HPr family phosphocarrier protein [Parvimonas sp.]MCI5998008.1 HPr family phosphocarrier protein [Parvimonas sp.]MDD7764406.1 HPr family phosphocarrier protein [Peptoniphilaceae bacterium]MDY3051384.1 HPr family phosphocarrier protein [Parvimonas sp.]